MTTKEKDYSDYVQVLSNFFSGLSLLAGFTLTILTLLIALLPDPSSVMSQLTFFFLAALFDLLIFLLAWNTAINVYFCRNVPPLTKPLAINNWLSTMSYDLSGAAVMLMFLLWNLTYLALASTVVWALSIIAGYIFIFKPLKEFRKTRARILGRVEKE